MSDIPNPFPVPGVSFVSPPSHIFADAIANINLAIATLPPDADGALIGIATDKGANAALVIKGPDGFAVQAWIGKSWGDKITYGATVQKVFRWT